MLTIEEVNYALKNTPSNNAPGEDGITGTVLKMAWNNRLVKTRLFKLVKSCVRLGYHPKIWEKATIMVIPKPNKPDYTEPRAYRPIPLLKDTSKISGKNRSNQDNGTNSLLPPEQFGGRHRSSATDVALDLIQRIETTKDTTSAILIDIQGVLDNI